MNRVTSRHLAESATQQALVGKGDVHIAHNLGPDQLETLRKNPDVYVQGARKGGLYYLGLNQKHEALSKPKVRQALKYLVDYQGMEDTVVRDLMTVQIGRAHV